MKKLLIDIGKKSKKAFSDKISTEKKNKVLKDYSQLIKQNKKLIIKENQKDIKKANLKKIKHNLIQRLILDDRKISLIVKSFRNI